MSSVIKLLPDLLINQIAAGEVVERPSSVVRELVENAIDAGATAISIALRNAGAELISVNDNGCGMHAEDLDLAVQRHATSKIQSLADLEKLNSLGFRGEALPSICAVAKVTISSRTEADTVGNFIRIEGGKILSRGEVSRPVGTEIEVKNLFYNTPARRKFLRSERSEELKVKSWIECLALAYPHIHLRFFVEGEERLNYPVRSQAIERAQQVLPNAIHKLQFQKADVNGELYRIQGAIGHPSEAGVRSGSLWILVNGRQINDKIVLKAVRDGYESMLKPQEFPYGYVHLNIPASELDLNVHPQKTEVRFRNSQLVYTLCKEAVNNCVRKLKGFVDVSNNTSGKYSMDINVVNESIISERAPSYSGNFSASSTKAENDNSIQADLFDPHISSTSAAPLRFQDLKYVGQILDCYLVCEYQDSLVVVDMHAAHERVNYNKIRSQFAQRKIVSQALLIPFTPELGPTSQLDYRANRILEFSDSLKKFGFEIEKFGENTFVVRTAPEFLRISEISSFFEEISSELSPEYLDSTTEVYEALVDKICARLACHSSVRSGDKLSAQEVEMLFKQLDQTFVNNTCPHGRPLIARFSRAYIERWFGRDR